MTRLAIHNYKIVLPVIVNYIKAKCQNYKILNTITTNLCLLLLVFIETDSRYIAIVENIFPTSVHKAVLFPMHFLAQSYTFKIFAKSYSKIYVYFSSCTLFYAK